MAKQQIFIKLKELHTNRKNLYRDIDNILRLLKQFIFEEHGLGLGNQTSQITAIWFINSVDHYAKEKLAIKYYGRYMDDSYAFVKNNDFAWNIVNAIDNLSKKILLEINRRKIIVCLLTARISWLKDDYYTDLKKVFKHPQSKVIRYGINHFNNKPLMIDNETWQKILQIGKTKLLQELGATSRDGGSVAITTLPPSLCDTIPTMSNNTNNTNKKTIFIIYASTGSGHKTAAESIRLACEDICQYDIKCEADIQSIDLLDYGVIKFDGNKAANSYTGKLAPFHDITWRYNFTGRINWGGTSIISTSVFNKLKKYFLEVKPDLVICTHMLGANFAAGVRMKTDLNFPIVSVPTDYETEGLWPHRETDLFCVATDNMIETLIARKVPRKKIVCTGLPVDPAYTKNIDMQTCRDKHNLPKDKTIALIMAGASEPNPYINLRKALDHVIKYFAQMDWMHFVFCTGKDADYKQYLEDECKKHKTTNIEVLGYTDKMAELMSASDIAMCKAGGMTVTECICAKLPMLIIGRGFAQEHVNIRYLTSIGAAYHATTYKEIVDTLCNITSNKVLLEAVLHNISNIRHEAAAYDIVRESFKLLDNYKPEAHKKSFFGIYLGNKPAHSR